MRMLTLGLVLSGAFGARADSAAGPVFQETTPPDARASTVAPEHKPGADTANLGGKEADAGKPSAARRALAAPDILESLHLFIETQMPWDPKTTEIDVSMPGGDVVLPDGEFEIAWHKNPQYRFVGAGAFRGDIRVDGVLKRSVVCRASIEPVVDVVVARREIPRGKRVDAGDVQVENRLASTLKGDAYRSVQELDGLVAKMTIYAGDAVSPAKLSPPTLVKRNQMVVVEAVEGSLVIQTRARATSDACAGDVLLCENLESKGTFQGIVRGDGVVVMQ